MVCTSLLFFVPASHGIGIVIVSIVVVSIVVVVVVFLSPSVLHLSVSHFLAKFQFFPLSLHKPSYVGFFRFMY